MKKKKYTALLLLTFIILGGVIYIFKYNKSNKITKIFVNDDNKIVIELKDNDETYCNVGDELQNNKWIKMKNKKCILDYTDSKYVYIKNKYNKIFKYNNRKLVKLLNIKIKNNKIYLAVGGEEQIKYKIELLGSSNEKVKFISNDENIVTVDNNGLVKGIGVGKTTISLRYLDKEYSIDIVITDKIVLYENEFNYNKPYLSCGIYSKEDNDLLDEILKNRIDSVGYKTRAGVVEAARFITLEFPYRLNYFSENGRLHPYGVGVKIDGEGRYYHKGLFLDESRYNLIEKSMYGPGAWGCHIYSAPSEGMRKNGFDCSGFISWIVYNGGYECEDLGAGVSTIPDMTDLGEKILLSTAVNNKSVKAGDLLSGDYAEGGHIALVAGIKDENYYVAESLWFGGTLNGAQIRKYTPNELLDNFYWQVDMDDYYGENGDYTEFWNN